MEQELKALRETLNKTIQKIGVDKERAFWEKQIEIEERAERKMVFMLRKLFNSQEEEVKKRLRKKSQEILTKLAFDTNTNRVLKYRYEMKLSIPTLLLDIKKENKKFVITLTPIIKDTIMEVGEYVNDTIGVDEDFVSTNRVRNYLAKYPIKFSKSVNKTTNRKIRKELEEGIKNGESIYNLSKRIERVFDEARGSRALAIARTETSRAANFATVESYKQSGVVTGKRWLTAFDERTCVACASLNGKIVDLDENFFNKGDEYKDFKIDYDDVGYPPLHVSCRCTVTPVVIE